MILFNTNQTTETMTLAFITVQLLDMRSQCDSSYSVNKKLQSNAIH